MPSNTAPRISLPQILAYIAMGIVVILIGLPLIWMLFASFKQTDEIYRMPGTFFPEQPTLMNYPAAWNAVPFGRYFANSLITTFAATASKMSLAMLCLCVGLYQGPQMAQRWGVFVDCGGLDGAWPSRNRTQLCHHVDAPLGR